MDWLIISLFLSPPALWLLYHGFLFCFRRLEGYFECRLIRKMMNNMERLEKTA